MADSRSNLSQALFNFIQEVKLELANKLLPLITQTDVAIFNDTDVDGRTFLLCALDHNLPTLAQSLIITHEKNSQLDALSKADRNDRTPLLVAAQKSYITVFSKLLPNTENPFQANSAGETAFHIAAAADKSDMFNALTQYAEKNGSIKNIVDCKNILNQTPLYYALRKQTNAPIIATLLNLGAELSTMHDGKTMFDLLCLLHANKPALGKEIVSLLEDRTKQALRRYANTYQDDTRYPYHDQAKAFNKALKQKATYTNINYGTLFQTPAQLPVEVLPASTQSATALGKLIADIDVLIAQLEARRQSAAHPLLTYPNLILQLLPYVAMSTLYMTIALACVSRGYSTIKIHTDDFKIFPFVDDIDGLTPSDNLATALYYFSRSSGGLAMEILFPIIAIIMHIIIACRMSNRDIAGENEVNAIEWQNITERVHALLDSALEDGSNNIEAFRNIRLLEIPLLQAGNGNLTMPDVINGLGQLREQLHTIKAQHLNLVTVVFPQSNERRNGGPRL